MKPHLKHIIFLAMFLFISKSFSEEGMWTFDNLPWKLLETRYDFKVTKGWLDSVRLSCFRIDGGSGAFVSRDGLIMTNYHVASDAINKISTVENNYAVNGFYANKQKDELKVQGLSLFILVDYTDVTPRMKSVLTDDLPFDSLSAYEDRENKAIIKEFNAKDSSFVYRMITLYNGQEFWVYKYKVVHDIRLVFAPEKKAAAFGGFYYDNFVFPRYDLDLTFLRAYENDKPMETPYYFKFKTEGPKENEFIIVPGNPGRTDRYVSLPQLHYLRDIKEPFNYEQIKFKVNLLKNEAKKSEANSIKYFSRIIGLENLMKITIGMVDGLKDPLINEKIQARQLEYTQKLKANPEFISKWGGVSDSINKLYGSIISKSRLLHKKNINGVDMFDYALNLVYYAKESQKPDADRIEEFKEQHLKFMKRYLTENKEIDKDIEKYSFNFSLTNTISDFKINDNFVATILGGRSVNDAISYYIDSSKIDSPKYRQELIDGGPDSIFASKDPMMLLAFKLEPILRELKEWKRDNFDNPLKRLNNSLFKARYAIFGKSIPPDATFSLRLSFGRAEGMETSETMIPFKTTLYGMFNRSLGFDNKGEFELPARYNERLSKLNLATPVNFIASADIIGGNSGSSVINRNRECVGLVFDGNFQSIPGRYVYEPTKNRTVCVHPAYIIEALRKLYDAGKLADELERK